MRLQGAETLTESSDDGNAETDFGSSGIHCENDHLLNRQVRSDPQGTRPSTTVAADHHRSALPEISEVISVSP